MTVWLSGKTDRLTK